VYVAGTPAAIARTRATVRELCARLDLEVVVLEGAEEALLEDVPEGTFAEAFIDYRSPAAPRVVVIQGKTHREIERRTLSKSSSLEMTVEEAAHVLYAVVESSLRAREAKRERAPAVAAASGDASASAGAETATDGLPVAASERGERSDESRGATESRSSTPARQTKPEPRDAASNAARPPTAREAEPAAPSAQVVPPRSELVADTDDRREGSIPSRAALRTEIAAFGSVSALEGSHALPGFGGAFAASVQSGPLRFGGAALGGLSPPSDVSRASGEASLHALSARLLATMEWQALPRFAAIFGLGGGADRITVEARAAPPRLASLGAETRVDPALASVAGATIGLAGPVSFFAALGIDVDLTPRRYVVETATGHAALFELHRVRPAMFAGVSLALSGTARGAP
jgi:hypothetical protein